MSEKSDYSFGHRAGAVNLMSVRTAERNAAFALPHLKKGMSLLDCGCGPGSITAGLASIVSPGEVVGVDLGESQVDAAQSHATQLGLENACFQVANVTELPFEDESFDAVFSHTLFLHVPDVDLGIAEIFRVLKPGGLVAVRDPIMSATVFSHDNEKLTRSVKLVSDTISLAGGDPDRGAKLGTFLHRAGFEQIHLSASYDFARSIDEKPGSLELAAQIIEHSDIADHCVAQGRATREDLSDIANELREFGRAPASLFALSFGEAIGWKPVSET
jgi:SAM-dependent methyltransferase